MNQPTQLATVEFADVEEKLIGDKQLWSFQDVDGTRWAVWEEGLATAIKDRLQTAPTIKVKYYEKSNTSTKNGKTRTFKNKTITDALMGDAWFVGGSEKPVATPAVGGAVQVPAVVNEQVALDVAGRIVAATITKSDTGGNLALHGAATINLASTLLAFFGSQKKELKSVAIEEEEFV